MYATLRDAFPAVRFLPGGTCHFIAGNDTLPSDMPGRIVRAMRERGIRTAHLMPSALESRYADMRMQAAADVVRPPFAVEMNDDLGFSGYVYDMIGWHSRLGFPGAERLYPLIGRRRAVFLASLALVAALYAAVAIGSLGHRRRRTAIAVALVAGFSGMAGGIAMLAAFQVRAAPSRRPAAGRIPPRKAGSGSKRPALGRGKPPAVRVARRNHRRPRSYIFSCFSCLYFWPPPCSRSSAGRCRLRR
ncbi:MAG: hypothetical protein HY770_06105 [Chitinivibrionia bacterium]|nr:hypothetical protein [Chitinivibrionia bacterium]